MATTAESAQHWLDEKHPSTEEIVSVIAKLEKRIEQQGEDDPAMAGSVDALLLLQAYVENNQQGAAPAPEASSEAADLDTTALIPDADPVELETDVKRRAFDALKAQFKDL
ncbi:MAG: hypothetical protein ACX931_09800 [Saccharospirillum sp.]